MSSAVFTSIDEEANLSYGFPTATLQLITKECWLKVVGVQHLANYPQTKEALTFAFERLQPIVPMPSENWYRTVFRNYDQDHDGRLDVSSFFDIIKQYHDHHAHKHKVTITSQSDSFVDSSTMSSSFQTSPDSGQVEISKKSLKPDVKLASHIMFPAHQGRCAIFKDYSVVGGDASLGRGSFGTVQVVQHRQTGQRKACKRIAIGCEEQFDLVSTEISLMKSFDHPNILRLHETYHDGRTIYLLMELCEGGQLFDRIVYHYDKCRQPITEEQVADWMRQILSAMAYCHERSIVHRDLKPENVLFVNNSDNSPIKVIDYGLSSTMELIKKTQVKIPASRTSTVGAFISRLVPKINGRLASRESKRVRMQRAGTPHYMAPEMIKGYYDEKCDIFSAGVLLYQLLVGSHPFFERGIDTERSAKQKILTETPNIGGDAWAYVSNSAKSLVRWMLEKNPSKRCSAKECLQHNWFKHTTRPISNGSVLTMSVVDGLKSWQHENQLKKAVLQLLAKEMSESQISDLRRKFMLLDKEKDGTITIDELKISMQHAGFTVAHSEVERICDSFDKFGDESRIGYNDFIGALLSKRIRFEEAQLQLIFDKFDPERTGYMTTEDLRTALKGTTYAMLTEEEAENIFREIDLNCDGRVDFLEFLDLMTT